MNEILIMVFVALFFWQSAKKMGKSQYNKFVKQLKKAEQVINGEILVGQKELNNLCSVIEMALYINQYDEKYKNSTSMNVYAQIQALKQERVSSELRSRISKK